MKTVNTNRAGGLAQFVEHLPKHEALSSNPSMPKITFHKFASCHQLVLHDGLGEILVIDSETEAVVFGRFQ
jgi:hypothetical protein